MYGNKSTFFFAHLSIYIQSPTICINSGVFNFIGGGDDANSGGGAIKIRQAFFKTKKIRHLHRAIGESGVSYREETIRNGLLELLTTAGTELFFEPLFLRLQFLCTDILLFFHNDHINDMIHTRTCGDALTNDNVLFQAE